MNTPRAADSLRVELAHIGKSVLIKGELSGSEDLYLDGQVEGSIELRANCLTIGPNGKVHANINAKGLIVHGQLEGALHVSERVELRKSAIVMGDIVTQHIAIEEGAYFKGKVDIQRGTAGSEAKAEPRKEPALAGASAAAASGSFHPSLGEQKK